MGQYAFDIFQKRDQLIQKLNNQGYSISIISTCLGINSDIVVKVLARTKG